ncbi:MAG: DUF2726 domain-containing protein [Candidatus Kapaibacterium sp.]|nr:MAG: DUF2726 domain-containing protein [Candidatus Kapabacteria bacterium]
MVKRLLNRSEEVTFEALSRVCQAHGARVSAKVRVADIFPLEGSGISADHFSYALKSHFDFVITNNDHQPLFSVEFDGPLHDLSQKQKDRDRLKSDLCSHFEYSLLRINSRYLSGEYRGLDLLTYFIEAWFLAEAFDEAQQAGMIPDDEPFDVTMVVSARSDGDRLWPYWLSRDIQGLIFKLHGRGLIATPGASAYVGLDDQGNYRCLSWVEFDDQSVAVAQTGMRSQLFRGVVEADLIRMLAMFELQQVIEQGLQGNRELLVDRDQFFVETLPLYRRSYELRAATSWTAPKR